MASFLIDDPDSKNLVTTFGKKETKDLISKLLNVEVPDVMIERLPVGSGFNINKTEMGKKPVRVTRVE